MDWNQSKAGVALFLVCISLPLAGQVQASGTISNARHPKAFGPQPVVTPPPTLEQQPASAPHVAFRSGQLTIIAQNSSLGAILREVQTKTGATVDMPANPTERVVGQFGPGPAREVLSSLLNGSHFNYVLLGSPQDATSLEKIVLLSKSKAEDATGGTPATNSAQENSFRQGAVMVPSQDADDANDQAAPEETMEPEQAADDQASQGDEQQGAPPAVKTPQQLLQELQHQQQIQQQQQGAPQGTPIPQLQDRSQR